MADKETEIEVKQKHLIPLYEDIFWTIVVFLFAYAGMWYTIGFAPATFAIGAMGALLRAAFLCIRIDKIKDRFDL